MTAVAERRPMALLYSQRCAIIRNDDGSPAAVSDGFASLECRCGDDSEITNSSHNGCMSILRNARDASPAQVRHRTNFRFLRHPKAAARSDGDDVTNVYHRIICS